MSTSIQVWGTKGSTCTDRIFITAGELNLPYTYHHINFGAGGHKSAEHLKRQPFGKVPAAEINGIPIYESRAIVRTIARSTPQGEQLLPTTDLARVAAFEQWASLESGTITPILEKVVGQRVFAKMFGKPADDSVVAKAMEEGQTAFKVWDAQLANNEYTAGQFSLVDIFLSTYFGYFVDTDEGQKTIQQYPNIAAWWQRFSSRPTWQKVKSERWTDK